MRSKSSGNLMAAVIAGGTSGAKPMVCSISSGNFAGFAVSKTTAGKLFKGSAFSQSSKPAHATAPCASSSNPYLFQTSRIVSRVRPSETELENRSRRIAARSG